MHTRSATLLLTLAASLPAFVALPARAADQTVLGKTLTVKDPQPGVDPTLRSVVVLGQELPSDDSLAGDPVSNGATVEIIANGGTPTDQVLTLPPGASVSGSAGWKALGNPVIGYSYKDSLGVNGPVKAALIKRAPTGKFQVKVTLKGALGPGPQPHITVVPPAPGTDGGMRFTITGGDTYCVAFGGPAGGAVTNAPTSGTPNKVFKIASKTTSPTAEVGCPSPPSTTTTSTSTSSSSSSSSSSSTSSTSTSTSSSTTSTTLACPFVTAWGTPGSGDGQFQSLWGVAVDGSGNVYSIEGSGFNNRVQKFTNSGAFVLKWGSVGPGDTQFGDPRAVAVDGSGNVYVADQGNDRIQKFTDTGTFLTKWSIVGNASAVTTDTSGHVFVAGGVGGNGRIQRFTDTGTFETQWGTGGSNPGTGGLVADGIGNVYTNDPGGNRVLEFTDTGTFVTQWGSAGSADGQFFEVDGLGRNSGGDIFAGDAQNTRIQRFTSTGTFLANWGSAGSGNGQFGFTGPYGIAVDTSNNVYAADFTNHRIQKFACP